MIKMVLKKSERKIIKLISFLFFTIGILCNCNSYNTKGGFRLEEFTIEDYQLANIVDSIMNLHLSVAQSLEERQIVILNFSHKDSVLLFYFSFMNADDLINKYIYRENKRILGYKSCGGNDIIFLSDIDNIAEFGHIFGKFIHPTNNTKIFDYIYYPIDLYKNGWPDYHLLFDPSFILYQYVNNDFTPPIITKNPYNISYNNENNKY